MSQRRLLHPEGVMLKDSICSIEECDRLYFKGMWQEDFSPLCHMHATRSRRTGNPLKLKTTRGRAFGVDREKDFDKRFMAQLEIGEISEDGYTRHLLYTGYTIKGYGRQFKLIDGKSVGILAHRYLYEKWVGPILENHDLDHRPECPKNCVNPVHLTPRTKSEHTKITASRGELPDNMYERIWETRRSRYGTSGCRGGD
jgi:hypothetical protein